MTLNLENEDEKKASFLDMEEYITDNQIIVRIYDKRDAFKFEIINYPDLTGNIPKQPAYGIFISQIIRLSRICSRSEDLEERIKYLTKKLLKKKFTTEGLKGAAKKCLRKNSWIKEKLGITSLKKIINDA